MLNEPLVRLVQFRSFALQKRMPLNGDFFSVISDEEWNPYFLIIQKRTKQTFDLLCSFLVHHHGLEPGTH